MKITFNLTTPSIYEVEAYLRDHHWKVTESMSDYVEWGKGEERLMTRISEDDIWEKVTCPATIKVLAFLEKRQESDIWCDITGVYPIFMAGQTAEKWENARRRAFKDLDLDNYRLHGKLEE